MIIAHSLIFLRKYNESKRNRPTAPQGGRHEHDMTIPWVGGGPVPAAGPYIAMFCLAAPCAI